jgi:phage tail sheath protein FI
VTEWVVFAANDSTLWDSVTGAVYLFLREHWRAGAMLGLTEEKAFLVKCDERSMTRDDILNGRLVCEIGVALIRPAEFVFPRTSAYG